MTPQMPPGASEHQLPQGDPTPFAHAASSRGCPCPHRLSLPSSSSSLSRNMPMTNFPPLRCSRHQQPHLLLQPLLLPTWQPAAGVGRAGRGQAGLPAAGPRRPPPLPVPSSLSGRCHLAAGVALERCFPTKPAQLERAGAGACFQKLGRGRARRGVLPSRIGMDRRTPGHGPCTRMQVQPKWPVQPSHTRPLLTPGRACEPCVMYTHSPAHTHRALHTHRPLPHTHSGVPCRWQCPCGHTGSSTMGRALMCSAPNTCVRTQTHVLQHVCARIQCPVHTHTCARVRRPVHTHPHLCTSAMPSAPPCLCRSTHICHAP